jgi:CubicO group peptidase (beta-lactamase class C family)
MRLLGSAALATTVLLVIVAPWAGAVCSYRQCPEQAIIDDLRAKVAAECDCAGAAKHRDYVRCAKGIAKAAVKAGVVPKVCAAAARKCEAKTTCGRAGAAVCCQISRRGALRARVTKNPARCRGMICAANPRAADACRDDATCAPPPRTDPGAGPWEPVPADRVAQECGLDPALLRAADTALGHPYAVVRYGKLCHEYYPEGTGPTSVDHVFSATKTLGALVTGIAAYETRDLPRTGRQTGPLSDEDRVDHWLDGFTFNPDAHVAHVLGMVAHNPDLSYGAKTHVYDAAGNVQINRLSDVIRTAIAQDPARLGADLEEFTQRFLFEPLGMTHSTWSAGRPDKIFGFSWNTTIREMARVGLLMVNGGIWNGQRLLAEDWIYRMTHPAFEDANTGYGYLTWLAANSNYNFGGIIPGTLLAPLDPCAPAAVHARFPHGLSGAPDCNYAPPYGCEQDFDVGVWYANGAGGHLIVGHPGLDLVLVAKDLGAIAHPLQLFNPIRPALVALDARFAGDEAAFCAAYGAAAYAPDLR